MKISYFIIDWLSGKKYVNDCVYFIKKRFTIYVNDGNLSVDWFNYYLQKHNIYSRKFKELL